MCSDAVAAVRTIVDQALYDQAMAVIAGPDPETSARYAEAVRLYNCAIRIELPPANLLPGVAERRHRSDAASFASGAIAAILIARETTFRSRLRSRAAVRAPLSGLPPWGFGST
jgi:hypothetical protein